MASPLTLESLAPGLPRPGVLCTLVKVTGSAPQQIGARLWASADAFAGTLGGGELERRVLADARALLARDEAAPYLREYTLCKEMNQCCGGRVEVFFEPAPRRKTVHLFGAGHVGRAVAAALEPLPLDVELVDARPEWSASPRDPLAYARERRWSGADAACIFTHSHDLDLELVKVLLPTAVGYLGLIGSEHKADVFLARCPELQDAWDAKMHCPIGLPLKSKDPAVIAVAVAAELLQEWALPKTVQGAKPALVQDPEPVLVP